jgi:pimeloyl-ACP methyl ester carboxylesterase
MEIFKRYSLCFYLAFTLTCLAGASSADAQLTVKLTTQVSSATHDMKSRSTPACPDYTGILDSISVPVSMSINLSVIISAPQSTDTSFQLQSENPAFVAAGDRVQGFLPIVTVPAGQTVSNSFALFGVSVGATNLDIIPLSPGFSTSAFPAGAWDLNQSGGTLSKFVDANPPSATCRDSGSPNISQDGTVLAGCGTSVNGVASDGATQLLMRTLAGLPGTACYAFSSTSTLDQGSISTPVQVTQSVNSLNYAFSLYSAPANYGDSSNSRTVTVTFTFTPSIGNGNTSSFTSDLTVLRPPVVLMHGLWSDPSAWDASFVRNDSSHTTVKGDYKSTNASHFAVNVPRVKEAIDNALQQFRANMNAATQVDLIGHSMGGILGRLYANSAQNTRVDNFNLGDIHRIVTLDTPHWGSTLANLLVSLHTVAPRRVNVIGAFVGSVTQGAVCDLSENSPGLQGMGATSIPGAALNASGGTFPSYESRIESVLTTSVCTGWSLTLPPRCTSHAFLFPQNRVDGFRFQAANDQIVGLTDQQGGVGGQNFPTLIHTNVNSSSAVANAAFNLLDGVASALPGMSFPAAASTGLGNPASPPRGVNGLGATQDQADYTSQCGVGGPMNPSSLTPLMESYKPIITLAQAKPKTTAPSPLVVITAPTNGQTFAPGDMLTVNVQVDPASNATDVVIGMPPLPLASTTRLDVTNFQATVTIPATFSGPMTITPIGLDAAQNEIQGASITINVKPPVAPARVAFAQEYYYIDPSVASEQLSLVGYYGDGTQLDLTTSVTGTSYVSSNPAVVTVSSDGLATVFGPGIAVITGTNGPVEDFALFVIENAALPLPPENVTSDFTIQQSGYRLDRTRGFFVQTVVVTNTSNLPIPGSGYFILSGLTDGVSLVNKSGVTATVLPGSSFVTLPLSPDGRTLAPGQSSTLTLQFLNPNRSAIGYSTSIYRTSATP